MTRARLGAASLWMIGASVALNLAMVIYHRLASSALGDAYAQLASLTGLINISAVVAAGVGANSAKIFSRDVELAGPGALRWRLQRWGGPSALVTLAYASLLLVFGAFLQRYLRLPAYGVIVASVAVLLGGMIMTLARSALQGLHRFSLLAGSMLAEGAARVAGTLAFLSLGLGVYGALAGSLLGQLAALGVAALAWRGLGRARKPPAAESGRGGFKRGLSDALWDTAALGLFSLLCYLDIFVAKHAWDEGRASLYSRAALVAKSFLYLASALNMVLLPAVSAARAGGRPSGHILLRFLFLSGSLLAMGLAFVWWQTPLCIRLLCGSDPAFAALAPLVRDFSAAVVPLALFNLVLLYLVAHHSRLGVLALAALTLAYGLWLQAPGLDEAALVSRLQGTAWAALLGSLVLAWFTGKMKTRKGKHGPARV